MKKYLLLIFSMLSVSVGAWATDANITGGQDSRVIITTNDESDLASLASSTYFGGNWGCNTLEDNAVQVSGTINQSGLIVIETMMSKNAAMYYNANKILDLSTATLSGTIASLPSGVSTSEHPTQTKFTTCILPNNSEIPATIPEGYTYVYSGCESGGTIHIYVKSGTTSVPQLTSAQIEAASQIVITGSGKDAYIATLSDAAKEKLPFDGSIAVTTTTSDNIQAKIEAFLISKGEITEGATSEAKATAFAKITSLSVAGPLTSADLTFLNSLTNLGSLNLTGVTSFGTGVSTSTINSAVANTVTVTYPNFFVDNNSTTGVLTITVLNEGTVTAEALSGKNLNFNNTQATIKISGSVTPSDISNIVAISKSDWSTRRLDLSEATVNGSIPRLSGYTEPNDPYYLILPPGTEAPTDEQIAYTDNNARNTTNGIYNGYDDLKYIIIPAAEVGGHAKIYVNKTKDENNPIATSIENYDINVINANNPSVIDVYNLDGAFDASNFTTLQSSINSTWSGKTIVYHATMNPIVVDGCSVTIDMNEADSKTLATLISEAKTKVTEGGENNICQITINGPLTTDDITALNTAMGSGGDLASITGLFLGSATGMTQAQVNALDIPTTLTRLTIPSDRVVDGNLVTKAQAATGLDYIYSPTGSSSRTVAAQFSPDYVYVLKQNVLSTAVTNEEGLKKGVYIKIASPSTVALSENDAKFGSMAIDFTDATNYGWQYVDLSGTIVTREATLAATAPKSDKGYRIILPDGLTGDNMAIFASNANRGLVAAVYSYTGTKLNIMEITDGSYSQTALTDSRIMRSTTTEVEVVSGTYNGSTYASFGTNLLAAINNMGDGTNYPSSTGLNVKKVSISTGSNVVSPLTFTNPTIETLELKNVSLAYAAVNVNSCTSLKTLNMNHANVGSVTANNAGSLSLTKVDLSGATINGAADFSNNSLYAESTNGFITDEDTHITGDLSLKSTNLTSFAPKGTYDGNIYLNASDNLASIDVRQMTLASSKKIHVDNSTTESDENDIISTLKVANAVTVPTDYVVADHFHPTVNDTYIKREAYIPPMYTITSTTIKLHEKEAAENGDHFIYWYDDTTDPGSNVTIGTSSETGHSLAEIMTSLSSNLNFTSTTYRRAKIEGPVSNTDVDDLAGVNCQVLDLSDATFDATAWTALKTAFAASGTGVHSSVRFVILPDASTREDIINETAIAGLTNVLGVIALNKILGETGDNAYKNGTNLTSCNRVSGALQAAVVAAGNNSCSSWTKTPDGKTSRNIYTSDISDFKECKISGLINSHDLSRANQALNADGHLTWDTNPIEISSGTDPRQLNGEYTVYGPFSASFNLSVIDLKNAHFEEWDPATYDHTKFTRYWVSDMTLSTLGIVSNATYKVVIPQDSRVNEIPADFLRVNGCRIRAICIPSNIRAIRTRAFYTIDYVWTTSASGLGMEGTDPEGTNTRLDNGAKLSNGTPVSALIFTYNKETKEYEYKENPDFLDSYYTADYSTINGGGTYTFGSNIRLIETAAFDNTEPNVKDVYVLNTIAPECHVDAFNTQMYTGNGGYNSTLTGGIISRSNYFNHHWITMLHYPRQTTTPNLQRYTDPTRRYTVATGERDGKGATLYFPNQSEFIRAYTQGTFGYTWNAWDPTRQIGSVNNGGLTGYTTSGWTADGQATANGLYTSNSVTDATIKANSTFYDVTLGSNSKPSGLNDYYVVQWNDATSSYSSGTLLYPQSEVAQSNDVDKSGEMTSKDYRGWHQFVLNAYAANTILDEEPFRTYIEDNEWWTICSPFDITREEAILLFGTPAQEARAASGTEGESNYIPAQAARAEQLPYVSKLRYVRRTYAEPKIHLNFSVNLMENKENMDNPDGYTIAATSQHGSSDKNGVINIVNGTAPSANDVVIHAGVPYMIKPNITAENGGFNRQFRVYTDADYEKLTNAQKYATSPRAVKSTSLYNKIKAANERAGDAQRTIVETGKYSVPVFVSGTNSAFNIEGNSGSYTIESKEYSKSTKYFYTFVGSFYNSHMPRYAYFLGWNGSAAQFYYNDADYDDNNMRWANETGIICPTTAAFTATVTEAKNSDSGLVPAQWLLDGIVKDDSFTLASSGSSPSRLYDMSFDAPDVIAVKDDATGIKELSTVDKQQRSSDNMKVYSIDGQLKSNSLCGLSKGIYVVNGKKYVVK